jgi:hypothetical protein
MPRIFFPTMWMKQVLLLDEFYGSQLKILLLVEQIGNISGFMLISIGITILLLISVLVLRK